MVLHRQKTERQGWHTQMCVHTSNETLRSKCMHCKSHWWLRSWLPKLRLCCPAAWPRQSSAAGSGATKALQSSPEDGAPSPDIYYLLFIKLQLAL